MLVMKGLGVLVGGEKKRVSVAEMLAAKACKYFCVFTLPPVDISISSYYIL